MKVYSPQKIGRMGERVAARFLKRQGYRILHRNRHVGRKELDLIVKDKTYLAFVEVKTRTFDSPEEAHLRPSSAVDHGKRKRTVEAALAYLRQYPTQLVPRFDVVEVYLDRSRRMKPFKVHHIPNAFRANGALR